MSAAMRAPSFIGTITLRSMMAMSSSCFSMASRLSMRALVSSGLSCWRGAWARAGMVRAQSRTETERWTRITKELPDFYVMQAYQNVGLGGAAARRTPESDKAEFVQGAVAGAAWQLSRYCGGPR